MLKLMAVAVVGLVGCGGGLEGNYTFSETFAQADAAKAEARLHEIAPSIKTLRFDAAEAPGFTEDYADAQPFGDVYRIRVGKADCLFHTQLLVEMLHVGYAQTKGDFNGMSDAETLKAQPSAYNCDGSPAK